MEREARRREGFACLLALLLAVAIAFTPITAWAEGLSSDESSVSISLTSDQESYQRGDEATFIAVIANEDEEPVNEVSYSLELPSGMTIAEDSSLTDDLGTIAPGDSVEVTVKALVEGVKVLAAPSALASTGDFPVLPILGGVVLVAAVVALFASKKSRNITLSVILVCGMSGVLGAGAYASTAYAAERNSVSDSISVTVDGSDSSATMTAFYAPGSLQQPSGGEGDSSDDGDASITRAQWVEKMLAAAEIQVSEDAESPYTDISGHSSEKAIATAYKLGAFADEQTEFAPDSPATREFALTSAVLIAGFHDDGSILEAADADKASHPSLLAIAVDLGMASIDDQGNIRPNDAISSAEVTSILEVLSSLIHPSYSTDGSVANVVYQDGVIQVEQYTISNESFVIDSSDYSLQVGDKVILLPSEQLMSGMAVVVTDTVKNSDGTTSAVFDQIEDPSEVLKNFEIVEFDAMPDPSHVILGEGVEWAEESSPSSRASLEYDPEIKPLKFSLPKQLKAEGSITIAPRFDIDVKWSLFGGFERCKIETGLDFSTEIKKDASAGVDDDILLATVPVPLPAGFSLSADLYAHYSVDGEITVSLDAHQAVGAELKSSHWRLYSDGDSEASISVDAEAEVGARPVAALQFLSLNLVDVSAEAGANAKGNVTLRDNGLVCADVEAFIYSRIALGENSPILDKLGLTVSKNLWTKSNSPIDWDFHWENGQLVPECTYGKEDPADPSGPNNPTDSNNPGGSTAVTPAEDFVYAVGDYIWNGTVMEGELPSGEGINIEPGYGTHFGGSVESTIPEINGGSTVSGNDCGYGVYITSYLGTDPAVVVPNQIDGIDVVYVSLSLVEPTTTIDLSNCKSLKSLYVEGALNAEANDSVIFGSIDSVLDVGIWGCSFSDPIDMTSLSRLESLGFYATNLSEFSISDASLKGFGAARTNLESLDLSNVPSLESLTLMNNPELKMVDVSNCNLTTLERIDLSTLEVLNCAGNRIADLSAAEEWLSQPGHSGTIAPQREA